MEPDLYHPISESHGNWSGVGLRAVLPSRNDEERQNFDNSFICATDNLVESDVGLPDICDIHSSLDNELYIDSFPNHEHSIHEACCSTDFISGSSAHSTDFIATCNNKQCVINTLGSETLSSNIISKSDSVVFNETNVSDTQENLLVSCGAVDCSLKCGSLSKDKELYNSQFENYLHEIFIQSEELRIVSFYSHGMSLGYTGSASLSLGYPESGNTESILPTYLSEEEQIKMAKRIGLIQHLPCGTFDDLAKNRECVICMIDFTVGDKVRYLPCMHTYHTECIDDWLMRSFTCPSCLEPVDAALLSSYETS